MAEISEGARRGRPKAWDDKTAQNTIKSLDRAMAVLQTLAEMEGAGLSELAREMGQSVATLYRVLVTLRGRGMVDLDERTQQWHIGAGAFQVGSAFLRRSSLMERARPVLRALMEQTGETANLGVLRGNDVLFVSQVETHETIRAFFPPGSLSPLHASGIGKAVLAHQDEARMRRQIKGLSREAFTEHTITEPGALLEDLLAVRERGYSIDGEEKNIGMRCIAAPIFDPYGEVIAGISVSGPTMRMRIEETARIAALVVAAGQQISAAMGAR